MEWLWKKWLHRYFPEEACFSVIDLIQYVTERKWNAKFWRIVEDIRLRKDAMK